MVYFTTRRTYTEFECIIGRGEEGVAGIKAGMRCNINRKGVREQVDGQKRTVVRGLSSSSLLTDVMLETMMSLFFCLHPRLLLNARSQQQGSQ